MSSTENSSASVSLESFAVVLFPVNSPERSTLHAYKSLNTACIKASSNPRQLAEAALYPQTLRPFDGIRN